MKKSIALIWGLLTLLPFAYFVYFISVVGGLEPAKSAAEAEAEFNSIFRLHMLNMLLILGLIISYIIYLFKTDRVAKDKKALWAVVLFMGNLLAMPIFWFLYVWRPILREINNADAT
jgi:hypothetical protein